ncbi:DUF86 domain-containing protein [Patescibacteria group bacterium]|nr:DUF86 domain-containing protein [Patescibacteria group bacterium]
MTNIDIIEQQISDTEKYLQEAHAFDKYSKQDILKNQMMLRACERSLYLLTQAVIDIAESIVSLKKFRKPGSFRESFEILHENNLLDAELKEKLVSMAGFRNALAHDYKKFDYNILYNVLQNGLKDIEKFIEAMKKTI